MSAGQALRTDAATRQRYDTLYDACPHGLVQQSSCWADATAPLGPDDAIFLVAGDGDQDFAGLPLYLYRHAAGNLITSVPQAGPLGGIFCRPGLDAATRRAAFQSLLGRAVALSLEHDCIALTIISDPFQQDDELYREHLQPQLEFENFTQACMVDGLVREGRVLPPASDKRRNVRRHLRRAQEFGLRSWLCRDDDEFDRWYQIHCKRHRELGAAPLRRDLLSNILARLGARKSAFLVLAAAGEQIVGGCLFVHNRIVGDVFIMSMDSDFADAGTNYFLVEQGLLEFHRRGVKIMNWQSSSSRASGVYAFKKQWGSEEYPYRFYTRIFRDVSFFRDMGSVQMARFYPGHYVVPFGLFDEDDGDVRLFRKL
ncbi:GNAT family N-acetyltransferase [Magnetospirillum sp. 15-1]|uniref:GNAT family N-acetyltransferase n=1 Tax=Magnetospirillum sp. 15-1 TaxID=1979370 RepID=UPI000BBC8DD4|nr:GNAT family N-acetyltransferase [Magnetospirillum sp. 15-1]